MKIPGCPIGYWVSEKIIKAFSHEKIDVFGKPRQGLASGDNQRFIRLWFEINSCDIFWNAGSKEEALSSGKKWFPHNKGGNAKWYGDNDSLIAFNQENYDILLTLGNHLPSRELYFRSSISWPKVCSNQTTFRYTPKGYVFDCASMSLFFDKECLYHYFLAYLNSKIVSSFLKVLSPTLNYEVGHISKLPVYIIERYKIIVENIAKQNISISKLDWDSHETSWDFQHNELISLINFTEQSLAKESLTALFSNTTYSNVVTQQADESLRAVKLQDLMERYHQKWNALFMQLHANEEELNRQFIDIYDLQDELTPDVPLNEITILRQGEVSIESNVLKWHDEVILKQLLSYAVGVWMGRYRLSKPGLHIAHPNPTAEELVSYTYNGHIIEIDDDGIFPLMAADSGFTDNACLRTAQFVSDVFGAEYQVENLNYIEHTLGKTIEQYWQKDFWKDHKKMYQNRPIYWLFASKKGTFQCIAYLHRMTPYTPERIRSKYLLPFIEILGRKIADLTTRAADLSTAERKKLDTLNKQLEECREYHDRLAVVAEQAIPLDLDDGVVVNYAKLGDVVAKLK